MLYLHKCPDTGRVFICREGEDNNLAEVFPHGGKSAEEVAKELLEPIVVVEVRGGLVEELYSSLPGTHHELIDWDNRDKESDAHNGKIQDLTAVLHPLMSGGGTRYTICSQCGGSGRKYGTRRFSEECSACNGKGRVLLR